MPYVTVTDRETLNAAIADESGDGIVLRPYMRRADFAYIQVDREMVWDDGRAYLTDFNQAYFRNQTFRNIRFNSCDLSEVRFVDCAFRSGNFRGSNLEGAEFTNCTFQDWNFRGTSWYGVTISEGEIENCQLASPAAMLALTWRGRHLPAALISDLMVWDATNHPRPEMFQDFKARGACPYSYLPVERAAHFYEQMPLIVPFKQVNAFDLLVRCLNAADVKHDLAMYLKHPDEWFSSNDSEDGDEPF